MFRNQYDSDTATWSPEGRLLQVEYAMEAVKQGSVAIGCRNSEHVVLLGLKRSADELASTQRKILKIDSHIGVAVSGISSDARIMSVYMRSESRNERLNSGRSISCNRLAMAVADKAQVSTQIYGGRPYGVGLLISGYDETGPHLFECLPSGSCEEYFGMAIGARSHPARTYLETHLDEFLKSSLDELIVHGLNALKESIGSGSTLNCSNTSISIVGKETLFRMLDPIETERYIGLLANVMDVEQ